MPICSSDLLFNSIQDERTVAFVDLDVLLDNYNVLTKSFKGKEILCVVKSEAYGHGAIEVSSLFREAGANWFGVASITEAEMLRKTSLQLEKGKEFPRILLMSDATQRNAEKIVSLNLDPVVWNHEQLASISNFAKSEGLEVRAHLKVDTGMNRLGILPSDVPDFLASVNRFEGVAIHGLMTHLSSAEDPTGVDFTNRQFSSMNSLVVKLKERDLLPPLIHCSNSAGGNNFSDSIGSIVRAGIGLYGGIEFEGIDLRQSITWKTKILQIKNVVAGSRIGYDRTYTMENNGKLAVVSVGYGDGFSRLLSNRGRVLLKGKSVPVVGRVSMDLTILDVSEFEDELDCSDEVILLGGESKEFIHVKELAERCETISYEIFCGISYRVPRVFLSEGRILGKRVIGQYIVEEYL
ncbi:MAG: alanine racemase [Nitrospinota bacterium]|nr:alanine racemase [Nitrospinota bacterium]